MPAPGPSLIVNPMKGNAVARSSEGRWIMAYLTGKGSVTLDMSALAPVKSAKAWWMEPIMGNKTSAGTFPVRGNRDFNPPACWEDAIFYKEILGRYYAVADYTPNSGTSQTGRRSWLQPMTVG